MGSRGVVSVDVRDAKPPADEPRTVTWRGSSARSAGVVVAIAIAAHALITVADRPCRTADR
ncbi:MAG: hypothetical protein QM820_53640 [Minicystis sp.]